MAAFLSLTPEPPPYFPKTGSVLLDKAVLSWYSYCGLVYTLDFRMYKND